MCNSKYVKIILTFVMVFVIVLSSFADVYARKADDLIPVFDFVKGIQEEIQPIKYNNKDLCIKGKAQEGTNISINTFWYQPYNEKTIIYKNRSRSQNADSGEWILQQSESSNVGMSGIFGVSVTIKPGKNKIIVEADSGLSYEMEVEYVNNEELNGMVNSVLFKDIDLELKY